MTNQAQNARKSMATDDQTSVKVTLGLHKSLIRSNLSSSDPFQGVKRFHSATDKLKSRRQEKLVKRITLEPLESTKRAEMQQFPGYGTLPVAKLNEKSRATSWESNLTRWRLETHELCSPRGDARVKKPRNDFITGVDESGEDSETSSSSFSSSYSSESPTKVIVIHSSSELTQWQVLSKFDSDFQVEKQRLLTETQIESGLLCETKLITETYPELKDELRKLLQLAYPVMITYVLEFFPSLVSMTLVGHLNSPLKKQYLDGVALSTMVMNLTAIGVGFGLATAMDTLCSQAYGAGKPKKMGIYLQSGIIVLTIAILPVFLMNWYTEAFLLLIGQPIQVAAFAGRFSRILLPGIPALYIYEMLKKVMQAQNIVLPMVYIALFSNAINCILGIYLSFYTSFGFDGAALARVISQLALPVCLIPYFIRNPHIPAQWWPGWQVKDAIGHLGTFLELGLPGMAMMLLEWWSFEIMAAIIGWLPHSVVALSVHSVLINVSTFTFNIFLGISVAANVLVGTYSGRNEPLHAKLASMLGIIVSAVVSIILAVLIIATRYEIPYFFINDALSIDLAGHALLYLMPFQLCDAVNAVMQGVFRGTGRLMLGAKINLAAYFGLGLPIGIYLAFRKHMGVEGMWLGLTVGILFGCVVSFRKIGQTDWNYMAQAARVRTK